MQSAHSLFLRISGGVAIFNNLLLITLILFRSHRKVGKYKYLMIYISVFEIMYAIVDICAVPEIYTHDSMFAVVIYADQVFAPNFLLVAFDNLFCLCFGISMAIFAIHFIYRFLTVSEHTAVMNYDSQLVFLLLSFPIIFGAFWFWDVYYFIYPFEEADQFLSENFLERIGKNISDVTYVGPFFWPIGPNGHSHIHWKSAIGILMMILGIMVSFGLILVFGYKCYRETKEMIERATHSASFNKLQSQLFYALVSQTAIPVVLMHIPASMGFIAAFFNSSFELLGHISSITICLYPTLDPLPNFFIIKNYREAICSFIRKILRIKGATVDVTAAGSEMVSYAVPAPAPAN